MTKTPRAYRVAEQVREILAMEIIASVDPRLKMVSLTGATISSDLREANIYWSVFGDNRHQEVADGLIAAKGRLRNILGKKLSLRVVPNLRFFHDNTLETMSEVEQLMNKVADKEKEGNNDEPNEE